KDSIPGFGAEVDLAFDSILKAQAKPMGPKGLNLGDVNDLAHDPDLRAEDRCPAAVPCFERAASSPSARCDAAPPTRARERGPVSEGIPPEAPKSRLRSRHRSLHSARGNAELHALGSTSRPSFRRSCSREAWTRVFHS